MKVECNLFIKSNALLRITHYDLASLFNKAYSTVATVNKGVSGFSTTGIFPINPNVFTNEDFLAAELLQSQENRPNKGTTFSASSSVNAEDPTIITLPSTSRNEPEPSVPKRKVPVEILSPVPCTEKKFQRVSNKQHSQILTSTPLKETPLNKKLKAKAVKNKKTLVTKTLRNRKSKTSKQISSSSIDELDREDVCIICGAPGRDELWFRCCMCGLWAHSECIGFDSAKNYV